MKQKHQNIAIHLIGIITFMILPIFFSPGPEPNWQNIFNPFALSKWIARAVMLAIFYLHFFYLIPYFFFPKKYTTYIIFIFVGFAFVYAIPELWLKFYGSPPTYTSHFPPPPKRMGGGILGKIGHDVYLYLLVIFGALALKIRNQWEKARAEKLNAEISYLRLQINPHFLFNALNDIYALAMEKSDFTAEAIVKLSGIMRYIMAEANKESVSLEKEITYIRDYIDLQQLRFGQGVKVKTSFQGNFANKKIAPLLLITFVENAFKYGVNAEELSEISVEVSLEGKVFKMKVKNIIVQNNLPSLQKNGIGLENTIHRLELLYPNRYVLNIANDKKTFEVNLEIDL
jgi:hypothetical protein